MSSLYSNVLTEIKNTVLEIKYAVINGVSKADELIKIGRLKIEIVGTKRGIKEKFLELGKYVYRVITVNKVTNIRKSGEINKLVSELEDLEMKIKDREIAIQNVIKNKLEEKEKRKMAKEALVGKKSGAKVKVKLFPVIFLLALFSFLLPFMRVSCNNTEVMTFTGLQMVTGTKVEMPDDFGGGSEEQIVHGEPLAIISFLCVVIGLVISFRKSREKFAPGLTIDSIIGLVILLLLKAKVTHDIMKEGEGLLEVRYEVGFWLLFLLLVYSAVSNGLFLLKQKKNSKEESQR